MQGYIVPQKSELKMREFEVYNAYYCAVCHAIRERYGNLPRLMLSYDSAFLSMLLTSVSEEDEQADTFRCLIHPQKKKNIIMPRPEIDYAADVLVMLAVANLRDDLKDEHKLRGLTGTLLYSRAGRRAARRLPGIAEEVQHHLNELAVVEKNEAADGLDEAAEPFAKIMEAVFGGFGGIANDTISASSRKALAYLGYNIGKWLYIIDAADDLERDMKSGSFNPLKGINNPTENNSHIVSRIELVLTLCLAEAAKALDLLPLHRNGPILNNIVYVGLRMKTEEVLKKFADYLNVEYIPPQDEEL